MSFYLVNKLMNRLQMDYGDLFDHRQNIEVNEGTIYTLNKIIYLGGLPYAEITNEFILQLQKKHNYKVVVMDRDIATYKIISLKLLN